MKPPFPVSQKLRLRLLAIAIAMLLYIQVHGQGVGSLTLDVPLQVHGLRSDLAIVSNLPESVRVTVQGLQARLNRLSTRDLHVVLDARQIVDPGRHDRSLQPTDVRLPVGMSVLRLRPEELHLEIDRIGELSVPVSAHFELPPGWVVRDLHLEPQQVVLRGPARHLAALRTIQTAPLHPEAGPFELPVAILPLVDQGIAPREPKTQILVRGELVKKGGAPTH